MSLAKDSPASHQRLHSCQHINCWAAQEIDLSREQKRPRLNWLIATALRCRQPPCQANSGYVYRSGSSKKERYAKFSDSGWQGSLFLTYERELQLRKEVSACADRAYKSCYEASKLWSLKVQSGLWVTRLSRLMAYTNYVKYSWSAREMNDYGRLCSLRD